MSGLRKTLLSKGTKRFAVGSSDFTPVKWSNYFENEHNIETEGGNFHVYSRGSLGPILLCFHGGGYSGLTWALFAKEIVTKIECQVLAIDLRSHGCTVSTNETDLSLDTLTNDVCNVMQHMYPEGSPPVILIGHSMGGAVAVETARVLPGVVALCVIDVVEGTALESLSSMQSVLRSRPSSFKSVENAIQWSFRSQTHNLEAAKVSMPGQIRNLKTGQLAASEISSSSESTTSVPVISNLTSIINERALDTTIEEETPEQIAGAAPIFVKPPSMPTLSDHGKESKLYGWRIDLSKTEHFWSGWFKGLSEKFLEIPVPKVLLLANIHGLDTVLTVGQMQGKFQFQVLQRSGHAIHEDQPHKVADIIGTFLVKQKLTVAKDDFTPIMPAC